MPSTLTALFATAIHEARIAEADPTGLTRAAAMLVTAAGARRVEWRVAGGDLEANGTPIPGDYPGVRSILDAFATLQTAALGVPAGLAGNQWAEVATIFASARGLYPTPEHVRAALVGIVPGIEFVSTVGTGGNDPEPRDLSRGGSGQSAFADAVNPAGDPVVVAPGTDRSDLSALLDPLLESGRDAVAKFDWWHAAEVILGLSELAKRSDEGGRAMILRERRRIFPESALTHLVREYAGTGPGSVIGRALLTLGDDGAEAVLEVLAGQPGRAQQRQCLELLAEMPGADPALVRALGSARDTLVRDAADVLGRRRFEAAVPVLGSLLRHGNSEVRTAAWRALESIGTEEAVRMIR